jgi:hypothetical protein
VYNILKQDQAVERQLIVLVTMNLKLQMGSQREDVIHLYITSGHLISRTVYLKKKIK